MKPTSYIGALLILPVLKGLVTLATVFVAYRLRGKKMEDKIAIGGANSLDLKLSGGLASVALHFEAPNAGIGLSSDLQINVSAKALWDALVAAIEAKSPAGIVVFEESIKTLVDGIITSA